MKRVLTPLVVLLVLGPQVRCSAEVPPKPEPPLTFTSGGELPDWAVGSFSRYATDLWVYRVARDGTATHEHLDGDGEDRSCGRAGVEQGEVYVDFQGRRARIYQDAQKRIFIEENLGGAVNLYEEGDRCGRDTAGCGGWSRTGPCTEEEIKARDAAFDGCRKEPAPNPDAGK